MEIDYLHRCRALFEQATRARYGRKQQLERIERAVAGVRSGRRLTYDDIVSIQDSRIWDADVFGRWPSRAEVKSLIESTEWDFEHLPDKETETIAGLFRVFRQIEPVSVVLRFLVPEHYGIMSPPVESVLWLGSFRRHSEKYQAYLTNLRELRDARKFKAAADVDMALWVLQVGVRDNRLRSHLPEQQRMALEQDFRRDSKLRAIRVRNLTRQVFLDMSHSEFAEALLATNGELAAQIASVEYERYAKRLTGAKPNDDLAATVHNRLPDVISKHYQGERSDGEVLRLCVEAVKTRNLVVHSRGVPSRAKLEELVRAMTTVRDMERVRSHDVK